MIAAGLVLRNPLAMNSSVQSISYSNLLLSLIPVGILLAILYRWSIEVGTALIGLARMGLQLVLAGYVLVYIFGSDNPLVVLSMLFLMVLAASWIALRSVQQYRRELFWTAIGSIALSGCGTLALITQGVLALEPWYLPRYLIPLAGMIFASVMNSVSLAAERLVAETARGIDYPNARVIALNAALIPIINSLFAVGLVSLPGMMTGQILSGVSPMIAVNYQIMVMLMTFGASGLGSVCFLLLAEKRLYRN